VYCRIHRVCIDLNMLADRLSMQREPKWMRSLIATPASMPYFRY
jgi:hypothetical protein